MKLVKRGFVLLLVLAAAVVLLVTLRDNGQRISVFENRQLADPPVFSLRGVLDGSYFDGWDAYLADHVAWRDEQMRDYLWLRLRLKRQLIVNNVFITDTALLPYLGEKRFGSEDFEALGRSAAERLLPIQQAVEDRGGLFVYLGVQGQSVVFQDSYPPYLHTHVDYYERCASAFRTAAAEAGLSTLFLHDILGQEEKPCYSAVDHHYNLLGAYRTYEAICQRCRDGGLDVPQIDRAELQIRPFEGPFYGTYSRKLYGLSPIQQPFLIFDDAVLPAYERWDDGVRTDAPLLRLPEAGKPIEFTAYMGGDMGETVIRTNRPELPRILIVGDSFTNPVECLCVFSFDEIRSLDFRKYSQMSLTAYLQSYPADVVVVIRDSLNYVTNEGNGALS